MPLEQEASAGKPAPRRLMLLDMQRPRIISVLSVNMPALRLPEM